MTSLLFDLDGVLLKPKSPQGKRRVEQVLGADERIWGIYDALRPAYDSGEVSDERFWRQLQIRAQLEPFDYAEAMVADRETSGEAEQEMVGLVSALIDEGWRCGVLANLPVGLSTRLRKEHAWLERFAAVTFSCDIGVAKPDHRAFAVALDAMGASAKDTLFFDDDPEYVAAAEESGLHGVLYTGPESVRKMVGR